LASQTGKLVHLGIHAPCRSTLSYANEHRPAALYEELFWKLSQRFRAENKIGGLRKKRFRFKNKLLSFDSTTISLCLSLFPWAKFRKNKGGVKAHVLLDHDDYTPSFVRISPAKEHDIKAAKMLKLLPGSIVAMDRAYNDFSLFSAWTKQGVFLSPAKKRIPFLKWSRNERYLSTETSNLTRLFASLKQIPRKNVLI
jgi:hypothetical protein